MDIQISHQWMDGFVKAAAAHGYGDADIPRLLKLAGIVAAQRQDPATFAASYRATLKQAGWFGRNVKRLGGVALPLGGIFLASRHLRQLPAVQALMRRVDITRDFDDAHAAALVNSRLRAQRDNMSAILGEDPKPKGGNSYGLYIRPTFMQ